MRYCLPLPPICKVPKIFMTMDFLNEAMPPLFTYMLNTKTIHDDKISLMGYYLLSSPTCKIPKVTMTRNFFNGALPAL